METTCCCCWLPSAFNKHRLVADRNRSGASTSDRRDRYLLADDIHPTSIYIYKYMFVENGIIDLVDCETQETRCLIEIVCGSWGCRRRPFFVIRCVSATFITVRTRNSSRLDAGISLADQLYSDYCLYYIR